MGEVIGKEKVVHSTTPPTSSRGSHEPAERFLALHRRGSSSRGKQSVAVKIISNVPDTALEAVDYKNSGCMGNKYFAFQVLSANTRSSHDGMERSCAGWKKSDQLISS